MSIILLIMSAYACNSDRSEIPSQMEFVKEKWHLKEGKDYTYRYPMLNSLLYNDTIRSLDKDEILNLLGEPDYERERHFYYRVQETRLVSWRLHTRTLVIKLRDDDSIEWIKVHE
ncbi:MAG: hypothetical protein KJO50_09530 [Bacteroidia bacterium]|nr:hypothetical protein [Bacteroidia bacterium]MBT8230490.1 hypothetical protein [Bacteroidia bacterium]NNK89356.1 hypothetical protein [Saprospiraceae bacterium]